MAQIKLRDRHDLCVEIGRVEMALQDTKSKKLKRDYGKHLKRLRAELRYYDSHFKKD